MTKWGWIETLAAPEPFLMMAFAYVLFRGGVGASVSGGFAVVGGVLAIIGIAIWLLGFATIPSLSSGHYLLPKQELITTGAFGFVRHPIYLGVFTLWFALAAAAESVTIFAVAALYVVPVYLLYIRSEEKMMAEQFGTQYVEYQARTGMVLPRLRK